MEAWRYRTPSGIQLEHPVCPNVYPEHLYYGSGTNRPREFTSSHINPSIGVANDVFYQQLSWIPPQDFRVNVASNCYMMIDVPRVPGYFLQSNVDYASYNALPAPQPSHEQSRWTPQSLEAHYPIIAATSLHIRTEDSEFQPVQHSYYVPNTSTLTPQPSPEQLSLAPQQVVNAFPVDETTSRPRIKVENSGLSEFSNQPNEYHAPYNEGSETLPPHEQASLMSPQLRLPTDTSIPHIKREDVTHPECSYQTEEKDDFEGQGVSTVESIHDGMKGLIPSHFPEGTSSAVTSLTMEEQEQELSMEQGDINQEQSHHHGYSEGLVFSDSTLTRADDYTGLQEENSSFHDESIASQTSHEEIQNNGRRSQSWSCPICCNTSSSYNSLSPRQERVHSSSTCWYKCQNCSETFTTQQNLAMHVVREHTIADERPFTCTVCGKTFRRRNDFKDHTNIHTKEKRLSCKVCNQTFFSRGGLHCHSKFHNQDFPFECQHCHLRFPTKSKLKKHMCSQKPKTFPCKMCGIEYETENDLKLHSLSVHSCDGTLMCDTCNCSFSCKLALQQHITSIHITTDRPFKCTLCDKSFNRSDDLRDHINTHTKDKVYSCPICQHLCYNRSTHRKHMKSHSPEEKSAINYTNFTCIKYRPKQFTQKSTLDEHIRSHAMEREVPSEACSLMTFEIEEPVQINHTIHADFNPEQSNKQSHESDTSLRCDKCNHSFSCKQALQKHIKSIHATNRLCKLCDNSFTRKDVLSEHVNVHTKGKVYSCTICQHLCYSRGEHRMHIKSHSLEEKCAIRDNISTCKCKNCPEQFPNKSTLDEHMRSHAMERALLCKVCSLTFKTEESLQLHRSVHADFKSIHQEHIPDTFSCNTCSKVYRSKPALRRHYRMSHDVVTKLFSCTECSKSFKNRSTFKDHMNIHINSNVYFCNICAFACSTRARLHTHKITHSIKELEAAAEKDILQKYTQNHTQLNRFNCLI